MCHAHRRQPTTFAQEISLYPSVISIVYCPFYYPQVCVPKGNNNEFILGFATLMKVLFLMRAAVDLPNGSQFSCHLEIWMTPSPLMGCSSS